MRYLYFLLTVVVIVVAPCLCGCSPKAADGPSVDEIPTSESEFDTPPEKFDPNNV